MMSARCFLVRCSTSNCSSCRPAPPGWNRTFKNGYLLSNPLISSAARSLAIAAYHMISPSLRASFSSVSPRALSPIRLICSNRSSTVAAWATTRPCITNAITIAAPKVIFTVLVCRRSLKLVKKAPAVQLGNNAAVHEIGCFFIFEERIGESHAFKFQLHRFLARVRFDRHPTQRSVINDIEASAVGNLHVLSDYFLYHRLILFSDRNRFAARHEKSPQQVAVIFQGIRSRR